MSGITARWGFRFSDLFLIDLVLDEIAAIQSATVEGAGTAPAALTYGVEATTAVVGGRPEWDALSIGGGRAELLEIKSGAVSADDRRNFWRRIRNQSSVAAGTPFTVGLVINSSSPPSAADAWNTLAEVAQGTAASVTLPASAPGRVTSGDMLLNEAFYWLCVATSEPAPTASEPNRTRSLPPALSVSNALELLMSFKLIATDGPGLEERIGRKLDLLLLGPDADVLRQQLEGWLTGIATRPQGVAHHFSAADMLSAVVLLQRFLEHPESQIRLWRSLRNDLTTATLEQLDNIQAGSRISRIPLDTCQPTLASTVSSGVYDSAVIVGDAGQGKSLMIRELHEKLAASLPNGKLLQIVVTADDLIDSSSGNLVADLGNSLLLGASLAALRGQRVALVVDGLDQVSSSNRIGLAKELKKAAFRNVVQIFITCRGSDWEAAPELRAELSTWRNFSMGAWSVTLVDGILEAQRVTVRGPALKGLLGNPLYLDLLLRTFGAGEVVPEGLQTRHGLLKAFWDARVLHFDTPDRIQLALNGLAGAVVSGGSELPLAALGAAGVEEVTHLTSVGVLARSSNFRSGFFRHPLLRDFAVSQWAIAQGVGSISALRAIVSPIARFGATRALVEALVERADSPYSSEVRLQDVASTLGPSEVRDLADILGTLQAVPSMDPQLWANGLGVEFGKALIDSASHSKNVDWLRLIATWPMDAAWMERQAWLGPESLECFIRFVEAVKSGRPAPGSFDALVAVSRRILVWSGAPKFQDNLRGSGGWLVEKIVTCVAEVIPDVGLLDYIDRNSGRAEGHWKLRLLTSLALIAEQNSNDAPLLLRIRATFESVAGLVRDGVHCRFSGNIEPSEMDYHYIVEWSFLGRTGRSGGMGLFRAAPSEMLSTAFSLIEAYWFFEARAKIERYAGIRQRLLGGTPEEVETARYFPVEELEDAGLMDDDAPNSQFWRNRHTHPEALAQLLSAIGNWIERLVNEDAARFLEEWVPRLCESRSATVWTQVVDALVKNIHRGPDWREALVSVLCHERMFEVKDTIFWVEYAAFRAWPDIDGAQLGNPTIAASGSNHRGQQTGAKRRKALVTYLTGRNQASPPDPCAWSRAI